MLVLKLNSICFVLMSFLFLWNFKQMKRMLLLLLLEEKGQGMLVVGQVVQAVKGFF